MKLKISQLFSPTNNSSIKIEEKFSSILISEFEISNFTTINRDTIFGLQKIIKKKDSYSLFVKVGNQDPIFFNNLNDNEESFVRLQEEQSNFDSEEDCIKIQIEIDKDTFEEINIYNFQSFTSFWEGLSAKEILTLLNKYKRNDDCLVFHVLEPEFEEYYTNNIIFSNTPENIKPVNKSIKVSDNCHFSNYSNFPFNPYYFELKRRPASNNSITELLDKLSFIFCITSLFDITSIDNESFFYYKLNGYKSFENRLSINSLSTNSKNTYFKIFEWVYSESSHISDKIGLARNILSLSLNTENVEIEENVYNSIQSAFQTYLKDNIKSYIEIRGKVTDELSWISQKSGEIIRDYIGAYEKSLFVFLSFFISVFLLKFLKGGNVNKIFTTDATVFSFSFLLLSIIFLYYSSNKIENEITRLKRKYSNLKERYLDLLNKDDIERILDDDKEFKFEIEYINKRKRKNTQLWIVTIVILFLTVIGLAFFENQAKVVENPHLKSYNNYQSIDPIFIDSLINTKTNFSKDSLVKKGKLYKPLEPYINNVQSFKDSLGESTN